jgi:hypothetical protein
MEFFPELSLPAREPTGTGQISIYRSSVPKLPLQCLTQREIHIGHRYHRRNRFLGAGLGTGKTAYGSASLLSSFFPLLRVHRSAHGYDQGAAWDVDDDCESSTCVPKLALLLFIYFWVRGFDPAVVIALISYSLGAGNFFFDLVALGLCT